MRYVLVLGKYGFFVEKITHFSVYLMLLLVKNKPVRTQLRSYTSCWSTFGVFETPPLHKVNPRRVWGDYSLSELGAKQRVNGTFLRFRNSLLSIFKGKNHKNFIQNVVFCVFNTFHNLMKLCTFS